MTSKEIKNIMVNKFNDENCYFTAEDVIITTNQSNHIILHINEYEHLTIELKHSDEPDDVKYNMEWLVSEKYTDEPDDSRWFEADNDLKTLLIYTAYHIAHTY